MEKRRVNTKILLFSKENVVHHLWRQEVAPLNVSSRRPLSMFQTRTSMSPDAEAMRHESGAHATLLTHSSWLRKTWIHTVQKFAEKYDEFWGLGKYTDAYHHLANGKEKKELTRYRSPVSAFQTRTLQSSDPEATYFPLGLKL